MSQAKAGYILRSNGMHFPLSIPTTCPTAVPPFCGMCNCSGELQISFFRSYEYAVRLIVRCSVIGGFGLLVYDYLLTFDDEVSLV